MTGSGQANTARQRPADVVVVSIDDGVLLLVDGTPTPESEQLVEEVRRSFVETGRALEDVTVIWQASTRR